MARAIASLRPTTVIAAGTDRGNEVLAHAAVMTGGRVRGQRGRGRGRRSAATTQHMAGCKGAKKLLACPFCTVMLDDGVKSSGRDLRVADLATLLAEAVEDSG